ncbi:MBL fold metallo-hydrolase [Ancylobacter terrae]|uniref:MBL fold metallo-hydrolase n=1 Tax=Ancylobacter sp. sgz301288 TaxID=3342077 RepID=UPI00385CE967
MLSQSFLFGDMRITRVLEMSGPTHDPGFLFPDLSAQDLQAEAKWLAPHHYQPSIDRLIITIQIWMVQFEGRVILIDPGLGNGKRRPAERQNMLKTLVPAWLAAAGATPDSVTDIVMTHLHADHVGGCTVWRDDRWAAAFPRARHHIPRAEFDFVSERYAGGETGINSGAWVDSVLPLAEAGLIDLFEPGDILFGRLHVADAIGHTPGQVALWLHDDDSHAVFSADIMHSPLQVRFPDLNTRYCVFPDRARQTRAAFLARAAQTAAIIMPMHFGWPYRGRIASGSEGYSFEPLAW